MAKTLSKNSLNAYVEAYVSHSTTFLEKQFGREQIARAVFPGKYALSRLSRCCSNADVRPLGADDLTAVMGACRHLLRERYLKRGVPNPDAKVLEFEKALCRQLNFSGTGLAQSHDFLLDCRLETATSAEHLGIPDILDWKDGSFGFLDNLRATQSRSIEILEELVPSIPRVADVARRLQLLRIAVSIASLNHPQTRWHQRAFDLALTAAGHANLELLTKGYGVPDEQRQFATRLAFHLHWSRITPTLDSPTNYTRCALRRRSLSPRVWQRTQSFLNESILDSIAFAEIDRRSQRAIIHRSGALSMKARLLAVTGNRGHFREADEFQKASLRDLDRVSQPYGLAYPVLKDIVQEKFGAAIRKCEAAIAINDNAKDRTSAAAFAGLLVQLTKLSGRQPTADTYYAGLAAEALASSDVRYKCSHIFDAAGLEKILNPTGGGRRATLSSGPRPKE